MRIIFAIWAICLVVLCVSGVGCGSEPKGPPQSQQMPLASKTSKEIFFPPDEQMRAKDAVPDVALLLQLTTYKITLPAGTVSRNEEFWRHIRETAVDVGTHDLLYKNGVRVGVASADEWENLKTILEDNPALTQPGAYTGRESGDLEMEMKLKVPYQNLFFFDPSGDLVGRTFERCDNLLRVSFYAAPHKPGTMRLGMVPVVRSLREVYQAVGEVNERRIELVRPEHFYPLNLMVDVAIDDFLVVAPSPEAKWSTSLGANFLVADGATDQAETLLIFRPMTYRLKVDRVAVPSAPSPGPTAKTRP